MGYHPGLLLPLRGVCCVAGWQLCVCLQGLRTADFFSSLVCGVGCGSALAPLGVVEGVMMHPTLFLHRPLREYSKSLGHVRSCPLRLWYWCVGVRLAPCAASPSDSEYTSHIL